MRAWRRALLAVFLAVVGVWLAAGVALALLLPPGWRIAQWPLSVPGFAVTSPEGARLAWTPLDWRLLRVTGQNFTPSGSRLGPITTLDADLVILGPPSLDIGTWRDGGGYIEVRGVSVLWGPLRFSGSGELRPLPEGGLQGPLRGRLEGLADAARLLSQAGIINTVGREVELPLTLRDRRLLLGALQLAAWP